jgi:hypothetical protein
MVKSLFGRWSTKNGLTVVYGITVRCVDKLIVQKKVELILDQASEGTGTCDERKMKERK